MSDLKTTRTVKTEHRTAISFIQAAQWLDECLGRTPTGVRWRLPGSPYLSLDIDAEAQTITLVQSHIQAEGDGCEISVPR